MSSETKQETPDGASELPPGYTVERWGTGRLWQACSADGTTLGEFGKFEHAVASCWETFGIPRTELATMRAAVGRAAELEAELAQAEDTIVNQWHSVSTHEDRVLISRLVAEQDALEGETE